MERLNRMEKIVQELKGELRGALSRIDRHESELELLKDLASSLLLSTLRLKESISEERKSISELRKSISEQRKSISELRKSISEQRKSISELKESIKLQEKQIEKDREWLRDLQKKAEEDREWLRKMEEKAEKDREWMRKKWGEMAERLGTLTEDIFAPGIPYLVKSLGYKVTKRMLDVEYKKNGKYNQYDAIVVAKNKEGQELVFVAEVKSKLRARDFEEFKRKLENMVVYEPSYEGKIVPVLAAFKIPEDLVNLANKRGVLLVRMGGEYLEPLNPEVLKHGS